MSGSEEGPSHELVIIRRRSHGDEGGHHGGVWKIAYADFMTAMMAFFLVMWLINSTDKKTLTQVATYFNPMRLTDKRPSPKGLDEPDGSEGKDTAAQKGAKKKDGDTKGAKKVDDAQPGEVRTRGKPFQREKEELEQKNPTESGATAGESARQAGGRAFRDPFDTVHRTEIIPSEPVNGKIARTQPPPTLPPPPTVEGSRGPTGETKVAIPAESKPPAAVEAKPVTPVEPVPAASTEPKPAAPIEERPAAAAVEARPVPSDEAAKLAAAVEAKVAAAEKAAKEAAERADAADLEAAIKRAVADALPGAPPHIDVTVTSEGVLISLTDDYEFGMFAIASAEPRPAMIVVMDKLAKIIQTRAEPLVIRGHTDRRRYRTAAYDNWRLSAARAHMAYVMLARSGVDEKRFERIEGHADRNLRIANDPEAAQNRRIEILLRKQMP
jgi:chemotaxis protein MotB